MILRNLFVRDARVLREARALVEAGHRVTVLALRSGDLPETEDRDGIEIRRPVEAGRLAGPTILGAGGSQPDGGRRILPRPAAAVWLRDRVLTRRLSEAARATPADVYHAHDLNALEPGVQAALAHGARLVYDAHELYTELPGLGAGERRRWGSLERRLIRRADAVVVPSASRGRVFVDRYGIEPPVVVMNCPEGSAVRRASQSRLRDLRRGDEPLLVYAGGFIAGRGLENVVAAISRLSSGRLVMIGWGPIEPSLRALADREQAGDRILFLGPIDPDEVIGEVAGADVGLAPYLPVGLNNFLAAPNKLFEYLHAGLAVAASDLPDVRTIVIEHDVGEVFDAADPASIADAVLRLLAPARLARARRNAAAAAGRYTWEVQAAILQRLYERLQAEPRRWMR